MSPSSPSLAHIVQEFLARPDYEPLRQHQLARALGLDSDQRRDLRHILRDLEDQGRVLRLRKNRWGLPERGRFLVGSLRVHPSGFGFVTPDDPDQPDVYIGSDDLGTGMDGDTVQVRLVGRVTRRARREPGGSVRQEGSVARVILRKRDRIVGLLRRDRHYAYVIPDDPRLLRNIRIVEEPAAQGARGGHKVLVALEAWTNPAAPPTGTIAEDLGPADARGVDMVCVLREHGLRETFPEEVAGEAAAFPEDPSDLAGRRDLRGEVTFTIDPKDASDFDDAVSLKALDGGTWELGVHIADVSHYVQPGSRLDEEARLRGNTAYLVDRAVTMLPPYLTAKVCSLAPGRDRLTHTVSLRVSSEGDVVSAVTFPSVIHSVARLDYDQVQRLFDGGSAETMAPAVRERLVAMRRLAAVLRKRRLQDGALAIALPEIRCELDAGGRAVSLYRRGADEAYHLVEEFMLLANRAVAQVLAKSERPALYRIHEPPEAEQWEGMDVELAQLGFAIPTQDQHGMNELLGDLGDTPLDYVVTKTLLTNLKRAVYSPTLKPHFGLAFEKYTHFTSPIRRYPDLAVHRALKALEAGVPPPHSHGEMLELASHCTGTERNAEEAERKSLDIKRIQFLQKKLRDGDAGPYSGVIIGLRERGLWVEMTDVLQQGLIPFSTLTDDHYERLADGSAAVGRRHGTAWRPGMPVELELIRVDEARRLVDFRLTMQEEPRPRRKRKGAKRRGRRKNGGA